MSALDLLYVFAVEVDPQREACKGDDPEHQARPQRHLVDLKDVEVPLVDSVVVSDLRVDVEHHFQMCIVLVPTSD